MSEAVSTRLMRKLREDATKLTRPKERLATLDRLILACDDIASGAARAIVKGAFPDLADYYRRSITPIKPPRVEEYVRAMALMDVRARRIPSKWTGPTATTIRKDAGLLEYIRSREQEQMGAAPGKVIPSIDQTLDRVEDLALRAELRLVLARARQDGQDLRRLKEGMRKMRPTIDVESLIKGDIDSGVALTFKSPSTSLLEGLPADSGDIALVLALLAKLSDPGHLSRAGLVFSNEFGNVSERKTKFELISAVEFSALRALVRGPKS